MLLVDTFIREDTCNRDSVMHSGSLSLVDVPYWFIFPALLCQVLKTYEEYVTGIDWTTRLHGHQTPILPWLQSSK